MATTKIHKGKKAKPYPSDHEMLKRFLTYNPETGTVETFGTYRGTPRENDSGYTIVKLPHDPDEQVRGSRVTSYYRVDHLAWLYMTGEWPSGWIEHVNGMLWDNAMDNLVHLDADGVRWWFGTQHGDVFRKLVRIEDDPSGGGPATDIVTSKGNEGQDVTSIRPRVAKGWVQRASEPEPKEPIIEPAPDYERGEFGKDWT